MMLMLKMLVLKMIKKYINIYKYKLSLLTEMTQNKQKALFSLWSLNMNSFQEYQKKRCLMLLEPIIVAIINLLNLQVVPDRVF